MFEFLLLYALALLVDIRLVWKRLKVTNGLAYYGTELITALKCLIVQATGANLIKLFLSVIYGFSYKARVFVRLDGKAYQ